MLSKKEFEIRLAKARRNGKRTGNKVGTAMKVTRVTTVQYTQVAAVWTVQAAKATKAKW